MGEAPLSDGWNVATPKGTNMAQDTPEGYGHQPPTGPEDDAQTLLDALKERGIPVFEIEPDSMLAPEDVSNIDSALSLALAIEAQRVFSNLTAAQQLTRQTIELKHVRDGWLSIHDRLLEREVEATLNNWGKVPLETYNENTIDNVREALRNVGVAGSQVNAAISEMQNAGILFRERAKSKTGVNQTPTASEAFDQAVEAAKKARGTAPVPAVNLTTQEEFDKPE